MSARISWQSLQNSLNPFDSNEESSHFMLRNNQNSISFFGKYSSLPRQQESKSLMHFQALFDNFLHKNDAIMARQDKFTFEFIFHPKDQPFVEESSSQNESEISSSPLQIPEFELKKGLKNLAKLLIKILRKKKFDSSKNLTSQIEQILMNGKKLTKNESIRQSKNIRRRTYDALNVMVAANVLGPDLGFVKRINTPSFTKKCGTAIGERKQLENKISDLSQRIKIKKNLLKKLFNKKSALEWWIQKKKNQSQKSFFNQQLNNRIFQNESKEDLEMKEKMIFLPAVFISLTDERQSKNIEIKGDSSVTMNSNNKIKIFSQIDAFQILKQEFNEVEQSPFQFQKSKKLDFRSLGPLQKDNTPENEFIFKFFNK